MLFVTKYRFIR